MHSLTGRIHNNLIGSAIKPGPGSVFSDVDSLASLSSSGMMLNKLKEHASLAISVTTGRKPAFAQSEKPLSNIIPGFGYALMDVFENDFVDMDSITNVNKQIPEEAISPFKSPTKRNRDASISKDDQKRQRREQRKKEQAERERKEKLPPTQYAFVKIKTSIGKHPVINYLAMFTNDEIQEGKKHLLNHWRRDPNKKELPLSPTRKAGANANSFNIQINEGQDNVKPGDGQKPLLPKTRAPGGIWLTQSDFPHAFQNIIVYHNPEKYTHKKLHQDIWQHPEEPYINNLNEVYIKLEVDNDAVKTVQSKENFFSKIGIVGAPSAQL